MESMCALLSQWPTSKQFGELEIKKENKVQEGSIIPFPAGARAFQASQEACRAWSRPLLAQSQPSNKSMQGLNININAFVRFIVFTR